MRDTTAVRVLKAIYVALIAAGRIYVWIPATDLTSEPTGLPPRHPERLRPDLPLTEYEQHLERQLTTGGPVF